MTAQMEALYDANPAWYRPGSLAVDPDKRAEAETERDLRLRLVSAHIPSRYSRYNLDNFPRDDTAREATWQAVSTYARAPRLLQSLLLMGPYGVGKTSLAVSVLSERITKFGERGLFMVVPTLFQEVRESFNSPDNTNSDLLVRVRTAPLLVLDDLGVEEAKPYVLEQLYNIINSRTLHMRPTIVTTNLSLQALVNRLGARTMERIKEYIVLEVEASNLRDEQPEEVQP